MTDQSAFAFQMLTYCLLESLQLETKFSEAVITTQRVYGAREDILWVDMSSESVHFGDFVMIFKRKFCIHASY